MTKNLSLFTLAGFAILIAVLFYRVIQPFMVALFIAVVLAVLVGPLFEHLCSLLRGHRRIAATLVTFGVVTLFVLPVGAVLLLASGQLAIAGQQAVQWFDRLEGKDIADTLDSFEDKAVGRRLASGYESLSEPQREQLRQVASQFASGLAATLYTKTRGVVGNIFESLVGFAIMTLGLYYFLADGQTFLNELLRLLPLERKEQTQLLDQFQSVCRGVVLGTLLAGLTQAVLAGIAFAIIGVEQLWLLIVLTMFCSFIPFVGAIAVWAPVAVMLALNEQYVAAIGLTVYGLSLISTTDNLIRAYVIGGEAKLHPLIALVSVLGALKLVGLWGIFIGPMVAAFCFALAQLLRNRVLASS